MSTKRDMIKITTPEGFKLSVPSHVVATTFISAAPAQVGVVQPAAAPAQPLSAQSIPDVGVYWPEQGGINGGLVAAHGDVPAHYLIWATDDVGEHEWGGRGKESGATSKTDGLANTLNLLNDGNHPAAKACANYESGEHGDFYLPAAAELYHGWLNVLGIFSKDRWYWSSSQSSAYYAFYMIFGDGNQHDGDKFYECLVRPVRRAFLCNCKNWFCSCSPT